MEIRAYREQDFEAVYALDRLCFAPRFRFSRAMMRRVVSAPGAVVLVAWATEAGAVETMAGFCAAEVQRDGGAAWGYVATLDVDPASRGRGIGGALMLALEAAVRQVGANATLLHVFVENEAAIRLYEGLGYRRIGREPGFYGRGFDAWLYRREL